MYHEKINDQWLRLCKKCWNKGETMDINVHEIIKSLIGLQSVINEKTDNIQWYANENKASEYYERLNGARTDIDQMIFTLRDIGNIK